jgi:hypothetical protein
MNRRDFERVIILSLLGLQVTSSGTSNSSIEEGWARQTKFVEQCQAYASNAYWWNILKLYRVNFDPKEFNSLKNTSSYASSLVLPLIARTVHCLSITESLRLAMEYGAAFGIDYVFAPRKFIEFVLVELCSPEKCENKSEDKAISPFDVTVCKAAVMNAVRLLPAHVRYLVLRRCLMRVEVSEKAGREYEKFDLILSLYRAELLTLLRSKSVLKAVNLSLIRYELELVDKRMDALAVLSSFFKGGKNASRPAFPSFFSRLSSTVGACEQTPEAVGVLGLHKSAEQGTFDPLLPLESAFVKFPEPSTVSALSPICYSVGLPTGYVHARMLCHRFCAVQDGHFASLPVFEVDVLPVLHRLKSARDRSELAEWCADKYAGHEEDKLACLKHAHVFATKFSDEVERSLAAKSDKEASENPIFADAVKTVKRIGSLMSGLENVVIIKKCLAVGCAESVPRSAAALLETVLANVRVTYEATADVSPETVVEQLLTDPSNLAAIEILNPSSAFSMADFREVALRVHRACQALAEQHSHVNLDGIVERISRRWLVHGDEVSLVNTAQAKVPANVSQKHQQTFNMSFAGDEDDTVDFVMDLSSFGQGTELWNDDVGSNNNAGHVAASKSTDDAEDAVLLKANGTPREQLQKRNGRTCLRIAFVLSSCATKGKVTSGDRFSQLQVPVDVDKENAGGISMMQTPDAHTKKFAKPLTLLRESVAHNVTEIARHLLKIAFSKTNVDKTLLHETKSLTFAMRHRAFRTAMILCPSEILCSIMREKGYLGPASKEPSCIVLDRCLFASHVAMEVESLGLQLPHSDLTQLSTMHFPSYARAMWRQHWQKDQIFSRNRFLFLLIELSLQDRRIEDPALVLTILDSMTNLGLTRTIALSLEKVIDCEATTTRLRSLKKSADDETGKNVIKALGHTVATVLDSVASSLQVDKLTPTVDMDEIVRMLFRLTKIIKVYNGSGFDLADMTRYSSSLQMMLAVKSENIDSHIFEAVRQCARDIANPE